MRTKTLKQISAQATRMQYAIANGNLSDNDKLARMATVKRIASRYSTNAVRHLRESMGPADLDEYGAITPVPVSIYAKQTEA